MDWPADLVERRAIAGLIPYARNSRTHSDAQVAQIAASIREFGWTVPVLVDEGGNLIAGHGRILAARQLGIEDVPCMVARGWTEAQRRAYVIADNKLTLNAGWDPDMLRVELADLQGFGFDLALTGFGADEIAGLLVDRNAGLTDPDDVPDVQKRAVTALGDVWIMGRHRLVCGDSTTAEAVDAALGQSVAAMAVTSPPYWAKQEYDDAPGIDGVVSFCAAVASVFTPRVRRRIVINTGNTAETSIDPKGRPGVRIALDSLWIDAMRAAGWSMRHRRVWVKSGPNPHTGTKEDMVDQSCESLMTFFRVGHNEGGQERLGEPWVGAGYFDDIKSVGKDVVGDGHPCPYPVELPSRFIRLYSQLGDIIAEPFSGSGTTIIAAEMTGRACHAIELSPQYCDVAVRRWQAFTGQNATLEAGGRTFAAIATARETSNGHGPQAATESLKAGQGQPRAQAAAKARGKAAAGAAGAAGAPVAGGARGVAARRRGAVPGRVAVAD